MFTQKTKSYISLILLIVLAAVPVPILIWQAPMSFSFWPLSALFATLGKLAGLLGLSVFALSLFLASRFVWLDKMFYGLPKAINIHRWFGTIAFSLVILHPIFLAARLLPISGQAAWRIFTRWSEIAYLTGYIALLVFMFLVLMTFFWRMRYEKLKSLHSLLAAPLMLGGAHSLLINSDVKRIPFLASYYIILISVSVLAYMTRLFLVRYGIKSKSFSVIKVSSPTENTVSVTIKPNKKIITAKAGQFIFVSFDRIKKGEEHPFSVTEISPDGSLTIMAKFLGDYTAKMKELKNGDLAMVDGPYGSFGDDDHQNCHQVWIAGGIGITPFLSMAQSLAKDKNADAKVDLFYLVKSDKDLAGIDKLRQIELSCPHFKLNTHISEKDDKFDLKNLKDSIEDISSCHFYICGPYGMIKYFVEALKVAKIPKQRISIEEFKLL